jgi:hypothetical protein
MDDPTVLSFLRRNSNPSNNPNADNSYAPISGMKSANINNSINAAFEFKHEQKSDILINRRSLHPFTANESKLGANMGNISKNFRDRESGNVNSNIHNMTKIKAKEK